MSKVGVLLFWISILIYSNHIVKRSYIWIKLRCINEFHIIIIYSAVHAPGQWSSPEGLSIFSKGLDVESIILFLVYTCIFENCELQLIKIDFKICCCFVVVDVGFFSEETVKNYHKGVCQTFKIYQFLKCKQQRNLIEVNFKNNCCQCFRWT